MKICLVSRENQEKGKETETKRGKDRILTHWHQQSVLKRVDFQANLGLLNKSELIMLASVISKNLENQQSLQCRAPYQKLSYEVQQDMCKKDQI